MLLTIGIVFYVYLTIVYPRFLGVKIFCHISCCIYLLSRSKSFYNTIFIVLLCQSLSLSVCCLKISLLSLHTFLILFDTFHAVIFPPSPLLSVSLSLLYCSLGITLFTTHAVACISYLVWFVSYYHVYSISSPGTMKSLENHC